MLSQLLAFLASNLLYFALHLDRTSSFPKPLPAAEEQKYFARMAQGDEKARDILIEHNLRLVAHVVKKYASGQTVPDDLLSIGTLGLMKAVSSFSYEKGTRFATYASKCIDNEILMYFRSMKKTSGDVSLTDPIESDKDGNPLTLLDLMADDSDVAEMIDQRLDSEELHRCIKACLDPRERLIVCLRYGLTGSRPLTQREIAKKLHISRSYVSRIEKKALECLKGSLNCGLS